MGEWTDEERAIVAGMKRAGMTAKQIAKRLGRSESSVSHQTQKSKAYRRLDRHGGTNARPATFSTNIR